MDYRIRITAEVAGWLEKVRETDPGTAALIDEALALLRDEGPGLGPPLVVPVGAPVRQTRPDPDYAYQRQLEMLARARRAVALVTTSRKRLELQLNQLDQQFTRLEDQQVKARESGRDDLAAEARARQADVADQLADLSAQYTSVQSEEERLTVASQRLQHKVEAFRVRSVSIRAAESAAQAAADAAQAQEAIEDAIAGAGLEVDQTISAADEELPGQPAQPGPLPLSELPLSELPLSELPLSELRPGAPERPGVRILFTVEPAGPDAPVTAAGPTETAVLLAAGAERDWLDAWYAESIPRCRVRYERDRGGTG